MTVPGKGGRPRKWASDADRVRAFRARGRGADEPATVTELLAIGDESAAAWAQARELAETVSGQRVTIRSLERELRATRQDLAKQQARFGWLNGENERLRGIVEAQSDDVVDRADREAARPSAAAHPASVTESGESQHLNRAQRRQAEKRSRRPR